MIVSSAIKYKDKLYIGARHHIILKAYRNIEPEIKFGIQGFIDEYGIFYNRVDAKKHVEDVKQSMLESSRSNDLFSEDLW